MPSSPRIAPRSGRANYIVQKGGAYYYRRMIPLALRDAYGKAELWVPLYERTSAGRRAEALALARKDDLDFQEIVATREGRVPEVRAVYRAYGGPTVQRVGRFEVEVEPAPAVWRHGALRTPHSLVVADDTSVREAAERAGALVLSQHEDRLQTELAGLVLEEQEATTELARRRVTRQLAGLRLEIDSAAEAAGSDLILTAMEDWFTFEGQRPETVRKHRQHIKEFVSFSGNLPLARYNLRMIGDFIGHAATRLDEKGRKLSAVSVTKRLDSIKALFRWAKSQGKTKVNEAEDAKGPSDTRTPGDKSYMPLTADDCTKLLATSTRFWTTRRQVGHPDRPHDLQVALRLLMATGARPNEVCQLRRSDVDLARRCITITGEPSADDHPRRRVKNVWSARVVPLHPAVWPIVLAHVQRSDHALLFPSFRPSRPEGYYSDVLSGEWTDNLRSLVAFDHPKKVLDSLRHTFAVEAERIEMPEAVKHELMGHTRGRTNKNATRYIINAASVDPGRLERFRLWIEKMTFPALGAELQALG